MVYFRRSSLLLSYLMSRSIPEDSLSIDDDGNIVSPPAESRAKRESGLASNLIQFNSFKPHSSLSPPPPLQQQQYHRHRQLCCAEGHAKESMLSTEDQKLQGKGLL